MRYTVLAFAAGASAAPLFASSSVCPGGLYSTPQCCATDVLGLVDLDCAVRTSLSVSLVLSRRFGAYLVTLAD